ncbi:MAG: 2-hydroxyglutaryl-CoA dehydratase [Deltaproteobacteria bacterium]|nr:2-hydroxyglutaryl-CoA dehydratase [Deltaproteobacteria bacterium]
MVQEPIRDVTTSRFGIDEELKRFEEQERNRLGIPPSARPNQWSENIAPGFSRAERPHTTVLIGGLTMAHDELIKRALRGLGYQIEVLDVPDESALRHGKEFGNRGQCNPTYFTVGNLVKHLCHLRDSGMSTQEIVAKYTFLTAGACGPCRFGTYVTEYRKALRDAGFEGFRVMLFQQQGGLAQATGDEPGIEMTPPFFLALIKAIMTGDILNTLGYRIRPYELERGATDRTIAEAKRVIGDALEAKKSIIPALLWTRRELSKIKVDRTMPKPKVGVIGEFWAMTTEGDGNYNLYRFLETEGAEVDIQIVTAWLLYNVWEVAYDTKDRMTLRRDDGGRVGLTGVDTWKRMVSLMVAEKALRVVFQTYANVAGLHGVHLPDMDELADISHRFYDNNLRGGEGHMEVGKLIMNVLHNKVNMTISVKPFGCMPSSGVSDGVQTQITELYPEGIFLPIETSGDGKVNFESRVQMMLFKAKQAALRESKEALERTGLRREDVQRVMGSFPVIGHPLFKVPHVHGSTAADVIELAELVTRPVQGLKRLVERRKQKHEFRLPENRPRSKKEAPVVPVASAADVSAAGKRALPIVS